MKSRKFLLVRARPPAIPRLCLHEPYQMPPQRLRHITRRTRHFPKLLWHLSTSDWHRFGIGLEDLGGPARVSFAVPHPAKPVICHSSRLGPRIAHPASTLHASTLQPDYENYEMNPIYPGYLSGTASLSPPFSSFSCSAQPFPLRRATQAPRQFARHARRRVCRKSHIVNSIIPQ